ncbi:hypothetical protein KUTeg_011438 [Tegillarca granosa]|uniref:CARD domain-containing protein n=1 Tax=Tegillarca granosa TaxID=220873 RepID=A0ABQ9F5W4_TEGGR|nr:hypothetical protein KUTeg_011438 [Tegillarca granosa]
MSAEHKQKLQIHRDTLVESMIPDDIFNDLIANKVLTTADVGRIKEKNTREAVNEGLLNNLIVRSDRAFYEFVRSLRKTLQGYLADLIDEQHSRPSRKQKRKRQIGELNVRLDCEEVLSSGKRKHQCSCKDVEEQILLMAKQAYQTIRRRDATPAAFEQFKKELSQTNDVIKDSMEIMNTLKMLCQHDNEIDGVYDGSVVFRIHCNSLSGLAEFWKFYLSGQLFELLQTGLVTKTLLKICHACSIRLQNKEVYLGKPPAAENLEFNQTRLLRSATKSLESVHFQKWQKGLPIYQDTEPRRAFKEMQRGWGGVGVVPSNILKSGDTEPGVSRGKSSNVT